jgi:hypothetical protein
MYRRISMMLPLALIAISMPCLAQTGIVTFYSTKLTAAQEIRDYFVPVGTGAPFTGWVFDGKQKMVHAQGGRFMTFHLAAGEHQFSAHYHSKNAGTDVAHLNVKEGGHYCIRLSAKYVSGSVFAPIAFLDSQVQEVSCQHALEEAGSYKPIDAKRVDPALRTKFEPSPSFPKDN